MSCLKSLLTFFCGPTHTAASSLAKFKESVAAPIDLKAPESAQSGNGSCLVFEVSRAPTAELLRTFAKNLMLSVKHEVEISFLTQSIPQVHSHDAQFKGQPTKGLNLREVRSFIVIREQGPAAAYTLASVVAGLLHLAGIHGEALTPDDAEKLFAPWVNQDGSPESVTCSLQTYPQVLSHHELQHPHYLELTAARVLDCTHVLAGTNPDAFNVKLRASRLIQGPVEVARQELTRQQTGGNHAHRSNPAGLLDRLKAMPWLLDPKEAKAEFSRGNPLPTGFYDVGMQLPIPCGVTPSFLSTQGKGSLWAQDNLGVPIALELSGSDGNTNMHILGCSGAGKSHLANSMAAARVAAGGHAWSLAYGSNEVLCDHLGGERIQISPETRLSFNPLAGIKTEVQLFEEVSMLVRWLATLAELPNLANGEVGHSAETRYFALLENTLVSAWHRYGVAMSMSHILNDLENCVDGQVLAAAIRAKIAPLPSEWFEGTCSLNFASPYLSFEFFDFACGAAGNVLPLTLVTLFTTACARLPTAPEKMLVIDEASLLGDSGAESLLQGALRRTRMRGAQILVLSQTFSSDPARQTPHQKVFVDGCNSTILMRLGHVEARGWYESLSGLEEYRDLDDAVGRREAQMVRFSLFASGLRIPQRLQILRDARTSVLMSPSIPKLLKYRAARKQGVPFSQAVDLAME